MINWVCALHCEAKPIIDRFRMHKQSQSSKYDLYLQPPHRCFVTHPGKQAMQTSMTQLMQNEQTADGSDSIWINLGIAGHQSHEIGSLWQIESVTETTTRRTLPCVVNTQCTVPHCNLLSVSSETTDYPLDSAIDMEGYWFAKALYPAKNRYRVFKVISDNAANPPSRNKAWISGLIAARLEQLVDCLELNGP